MYMLYYRISLNKILGRAFIHHLLVIIFFLNTPGIYLFQPSFSLIKEVIGLVCALHVIYCALVAVIYLICNLICSMSVNDCYTPDAPDDDPEITVDNLLEHLNKMKSSVLIY